MGDIPCTVALRNKEWIRRSLSDFYIYFEERIYTLTMALDKESNEEKEEETHESVQNFQLVSSVEL